MINLERISKERLLKEGWRFIRITEDGGNTGDKPKIKVCEEFGVWRTEKVFDTKKARDEYARHMIETTKTLYLY